MLPDASQALPEDCQPGAAPPCAPVTREAALGPR